MFNRTVRQYYSKSSDIVSGHTVFDGSHATGVGRNIAADRCRLLTWIRRIEEIPFFDIGLQFHQKDTRFYSYREVVFIELQDPVHLFGADHDTFMKGDRGSDKICA